MESWVLDGDKYSFLRSAPRNFNLRHRDGPNHVEIFDITSIPSPRSAISETTCLCEIFGDDSETLSSSPSSTSCLRKEVDAHLVAEDVNDSSGSYHTAHSSEQLSDTSDTFEDSKETISPKHTEDLVLPETRESHSPSAELDDKKGFALENGSPPPSKAEESDLPLTENQQELSLSQGNMNKTEDIDSHAQALVLTTSESRDTNIRVADPLKGNLLPTVSHEPLDKSSEMTKSNTSVEENNVVRSSGEKNAKLSLPDLRSNSSSSTENLSKIQEADLNISPGNRDSTSIQSCPSTPERALTPVLRDYSSSPACMEINATSALDVTSEPRPDSAETMRLPSNPLQEDNSWIPEEPRTVPSPTHSSEENAEINVSFVPHHSSISPETREETASPDPGRRSFPSDTDERHEPPEESEFCSFPDSLLATHFSEPSVVIHTPLGYTISPSPEFERKVFSAEPEASSPTSEIPEYTETPTDFRSSVSSPDSKLCLTPESRSVTSTPEIRHNFLTPDSIPTAPSPELMSATCSPEIRAITCSVLSQSPKSPIQGITYRVVASQNKVLEQDPDAEEVRGATHSTEDVRNLTPNLSFSPEDKSRPSSTTLNIPADATPSPEIKDQGSPERCNEHMPVPESCKTMEQADSNDVSKDVDLPLFGSVDREQFVGCIKPIKGCSPALDECKDFASVILSPKQIRKTVISVHPGVKSTAIPMDECSEKINESMLTDSLEGNDSCSGTEMLERASVGSVKPLGHKLVRPRESPNVFHTDNDRKYGQQPCKNKGWSEERVVQGEHTLEKGVASKEECSYRGEQVELSFRDRNRKGPASYSAAPSSGDPKSGIPAYCYFESPLTTRQQQCLFRAQGVQKENKSGARRVQSAFQSKHIGAGRLPSGCTSETSSMGSEFDEADNEVKWFTDLAFRSLSSPHGDYLDVYSSSHRSSTNVSHPSTVDSPGAATWMSYADLRGSTLHENEERLCHTASFLPHGTLDPTKRFEMGSFECVDVAVESKEESRKGKRTVPKRQIQLKRRNPDESKSTENAEKVLDSPSVQRRSRDSLFRQHSTPAAVQENVFECDTKFQTDKKMLQKSASFDETSTKTKMASCIIKSVLSKKMETNTKDSSMSEDSSASEDKKKHTETLSIGPSNNKEKLGLSSSQPSECSLSSEDFAGRQEKSPQLQKKKCGPKVPPKPFLKANFIPFCNNSGVDALQDNTSVSDQMRPRLVDRFESKIHNKQFTSEKEAEISNLEEKENCESTNTIARKKSSVATQATSRHGRTANRDMEDAATPETQKQQHGRRMFLSKTPEITLKPCTVKDKKKSSLSVSLSPDESTEDASQLEETPEVHMRFKEYEDLENEEDTKKMKPKPVMHKVRDVRKLVKNTYNLSFKASNTTHPVEEIDTQNNKEIQQHNPHALHIECKAVSWRKKQTSGHKTSNLPETHPADNSDTKKDSEKRKDMNITEISDKPSSPKLILESQQKTTSILSDVDRFVGTYQCRNSTATSENCEQSTDPTIEMPSRPSSKETSSVVFVKDGISSATQKPASPASPEAKTMSSSHSVSMLLKEKGMQADIGVCEVLNEATSTSAKHINILEVPLQICASDELLNVSQKGKREEVLPNEQTYTACESVSLASESPKPKICTSEALVNNLSQTASIQPLKEKEKMANNASTSVTKISAPPATSNKPEVSSFTSNIKGRAMPVTTSKEIELPIQVRSISSDRPKPSVPPKPSYKQPFTEIRSISSDPPKTDIASTPSIFEQQKQKSDAKENEPSALVTKRDPSAEVAPNNTKKLSVSAVSSYKPPSIPLNTVSGSVQKSATNLTTTSLATGRQQVSNTSVQNSSNRQQLNMTISQEEVLPSSHAIFTVASQGSTYKQSSSRESPNIQFHFPASDDPPSYDDRESFSPLLLSDLPPRRPNRYHPNNKHSPNSYTTAPHPHLGLPYHSSPNRTPPAPESPGQGLSYPGAPPQAQVRPHQCRQESQPLNYPPVSSKTTVPQGPAMIQPLHHSFPCPDPVTQSYSDEQQPPCTQQMERHSANHPSSGAAYCVHSRSPNIGLDPRPQFFSPHDLPTAFGHDYGSDGPGSSNVLYPENTGGLGYGQGPRRVLLDPETGKYFYIEVPMQPLRKMLFDPELGQYVEVLIPQQAGVYPPTAVPYPSLHGPGIYAPQYLPYAAPPHSQSAQQPRNPESSVSTSLHQTSMAYGSSANQTSKSEAKSHPTLDQSYLESMYYIPTGMNASPNTTPSNCYPKRSPNMSATGGQKSMKQY